MRTALPRRALCAVMIVLLLGTLSGCGSNEKQEKRVNLFPAMADMIVLTLDDYQDLSKADRLKGIDVMTDIVFLSKEDLPAKP